MSQNVNFSGFEQRENLSWPFGQHTNAPHYLLAFAHCSRKQLRLLSFARKLLLQSSSHVGQRSKGPFRLWQRCQGHDGRQEGRQEEACVSVSSCRTAVSCRKDPQTVEGRTARCSMKAGVLVGYCGCCCGDTGVQI